MNRQKQRDITNICQKSRYNSLYNQTEIHEGDFRQLMQETAFEIYKDDICEPCYDDDKSQSFDEYNEFSKKMDQYETLFE